jgi:orotate phosphoribosyltransferase-like protein
MSKMGELVLEMEELVEQGMSAKFIAAKLNVPIEWAMQAIEDRHQLEEQKRQEFIGYGEEL